MRAPAASVAGRYELVRRLGSGGIATVHLARDSVLGEDVVLKILHPHLRRQKALLDAFRREVTISRTLDHPAIVRIHDCGEDPATGLVYLAMEYLRGGDLKRMILSRGPLEPQEVVRVGSAILDGLEAAHARGIVHRDVKPHNILFGPLAPAGAACKLSDFGLASCGTLFALDETFRSAGTPEYAAPESASSGYTDARSDLYSLGVTLYEAATGLLPFVAPSAYEVLKLHAEAEPRPPRELRADLPDGLSRSILRALAKDPGARFQTAREFREALATGMVPELAVSQKEHPCPGCGRSVPDAFPYCFSCRRDLMVLTPSREGEARFRVVVTGPGKPGDQLAHELRYRCLNLLQEVHADTARMSRHLPRVPFVLLDSLDEASARELERRVRACGLEATAVRRGERAAWRPAGKLMRRKDILLSLRVMGIALMGGGGAFQGLVHAGRGGAAAPLVVLFGAALLSIPLVTMVRSRLAEVRWRRGEAVGRGMRRYLELAPSISSPALQALVRRIVSRLDTFRTATFDLDPEICEEVTRSVEELVERSADWVEACQALDSALEGLDEREIYRKIEELDRVLAEAADGDAASRAVQARSQAREALQRRRVTVGRRERLLDQLLSFSARLDALALRLGALRSHHAVEVAGELSRLEQELGDLGEGIREAEGAGGPE